MTDRVSCASARCAVAVAVAVAACGQPLSDQTDRRGNHIISSPSLGREREGEMIEQLGSCARPRLRSCGDACVLPLLPANLLAWDSMSVLSTAVTDGGEAGALFM